MLSKSEIQNRLNNQIPLYIFDVIDSTNSFAKTLSEDFALVVSDCQTNGRGRLNRSFHSPKGTGIYLTLKVNIQNLYHNVPFVTTLASVAVHKTIKELCNIDCGIKWVNDIYIGNKKVSGILCEAVDSSHVLIGIGINFLKASLPVEIQDTATFLFDENPCVSREEIIASVADNIIQMASELPDTSFMEYYKSRSIVIGKNILCIQSGNTFEAVALDIDLEGGLVIQCDQGLKTLRTGEVSIRFK